MLRRRCRYPSPKLGTYSAGSHQRPLNHCHHHPMPMRLHFLSRIRQCSLGHPIWFLSWTHPFWIHHFSSRLSSVSCIGDGSDPSHHNSSIQHLFLASCLYL